MGEHEYMLLQKTITWQNAKILELQERSEWISVEDEKPEIDETVLLMHYYNGDIIWIASGDRMEGLNKYGCDWDDDEFIATHFHTVTHWRPLPEAPNE